MSDTTVVDKNKIEKGDLLKVFQLTGEQQIYHVREIKDGELRLCEIGEKEEIFVQIFKKST